MDMPDVSTALDDPRAGVRWKILAYRTLSRAEAIACVRQFLLASRKRRRIKPGTEITIVTTIGIGD